MTKALAAELKSLRNMENEFHDEKSSRCHPSPRAPDLLCGRRRRGAGAEDKRDRSRSHQRESCRHLRNRSHLPSAPKLGCGSRAKRVLATLTADARVAAAWVNEAGTHLVIAWTQVTAALTADQLNEILRTHGLAVNAIGDKTRTALLVSFRTNQGWFDSATIDELSRNRQSSRSVWCAASRSACR